MGSSKKLRITKTESFCDRVFFGHNPVGVMSGKLRSDETLGVSLLGYFWAQNLIDSEPRN
jgi:hypothetical protein